MATAAFCATRASFAAPTRADAARGCARAIVEEWRAATTRASPASPSAEPSSFRLDARGAGVRVARLRRLARRAVADTRHPPALFDDRDGRRDAAERAPLDGAAEGETRDVDAETGSGDAHHVGEEKEAPVVRARNDANPLAREGLDTAATNATNAITGPTADDVREDGSNAKSKWPWWVDMLNRSLETHPGFVLIGFVCVDMGSALCLLFLITKMKVAVDADFALAYALSKSIRAPRLALDAAVAAELARRFPALAAVRVGPILDAGVQLGAELKNTARSALRRFSSKKTLISFSRGARGARDTRESRSRRAAREAREMTDAYGLAYMTAKNVIGPVSIALFYAALKYGVDLRGALASAGANVGAGAAAGAGETAGALALASWVSTVFFPLVVLGAGFIGPKMGRAAERAARGVRRVPRVPEWGHL